MMRGMVACAPGAVDVWQWPDALLDRSMNSPTDVLRRVLGWYLGCDSHSVELARGMHGKPRLAPGTRDADIRFNLSHSGGSVVVAVTIGREVGVDLQAGFPLDRLEGLVHYYTRDEQSLAASIPAGPERVELLRRLWVSKEALVKATGEGITPAFRKLDMSAAARAGTITMRRPMVGEDMARTWTVQPLALPRLPHPAALAVEGDRPTAVVLRNWPADDG